MLVFVELVLYLACIYYAYNSFTQECSLWHMCKDETAVYALAWFFLYFVRKNMKGYTKLPKVLLLILVLVVNNKLNSAPYFNGFVGYLLANAIDNQNTNVFALFFILLIVPFFSFQAIFAIVICSIISMILDLGIFDAASFGCTD